MRSFRPSVVVKCCEAFEEDKWNTVSIGSVILRKFKDCPRYLFIAVSVKLLYVSVPIKNRMKKKHFRLDVH
jgi:uncharacterized protein YcbX